MKLEVFLTTTVCVHIADDDEELRKPTSQRLRMKVLKAREKVQELYPAHVWRVKAVQPRSAYPLTRPW